MKTPLSLGFIASAVSAFAFSGQAQAKIESPDQTQFQNEVDALLAMPEGQKAIAINYWSLEQSLGDADSLKELYAKDGIQLAYNGYGWYTGDSTSAGWNAGCYSACYGNCYSNCHSNCYSQCNG